MKPLHFLIHQHLGRCPLKFKVHAGARLQRLAQGRCIQRRHSLAPLPDSLQVSMRDIFLFHCYTKGYAPRKPLLHPWKLGSKFCLHPCRTCSDCQSGLCGWSKQSGGGHLHPVRGHLEQQSTLFNLCCLSSFCRRLASTIPRSMPSKWYSQFVSLQAMALSKLPCIPQEVLSLMEFVMPLDFGLCRAASKCHL